MPRYLLDTDTCSCVMKRASHRLTEKLRTVAPADVCISVVTKAELMYGVELSPRHDRDAAALEAFLRHVRVLELGEKAAGDYADIRANLKRRGQMIGAHDLFIAAHARSMALTLITNNTDEFGRVEKLTIENWTR